MIGRSKTTFIVGFHCDRTTVKLGYISSANRDLKIFITCNA